MTRYLLSPAAQADLSETWDYSTQNWGQNGPIATFLVFEDACEALAAGLQRGRPINDVRPGYRSSPCNRIFCSTALPTPGLIDVVRILRQRMDVAARLKD